MRRTRPLVNILGNKVIMKGMAGTALAAIAFKAGKQGHFCLMHRVRQCAVRHRQFKDGLLIIFFYIRVKQVCFCLQIIGELHIIAGKIILQRTDREKQVPGQGQQVIPDCTGQQ